MKPRRLVQVGPEEAGTGETKEAGTGDTRGGWYRWDQRRLVQVRPEEAGTGETRGGWYR